MNVGVTILTYHRVLTDDACLGYPFPSLVMPASVFEQQVLYLAKHFDVVPVSEAVHRLPQESNSRPLVCITFDDGYRDNHDIAAKTLQRVGVRGTFFVTAGFIGTDDFLWFDIAAWHWRSLDAHGRHRICEKFSTDRTLQFDPNNFLSWMHFLKQSSPEIREAILGGYSRKKSSSTSDCRLMTADQLCALRKAGHEIGSHTLNHPLLPQLNPHQLQHELEEPRRHLQQMLNVDITGLCYPNGDFDDRVILAAKAAGYRYACTTATGMVHSTSDMMRLPRIEMNPLRIARDGRYDELALRSELCLLEKAWRR